MASEGTIRAIERTFRIAEFLGTHGPVGLSAIATGLELPKSTVYRHLRTLEGEGYVTDDEGNYALSLRFLDLGERARGRHSEYRLAAEKVGELADRTAERAQFTIEEHGRAVYVHQQMGANAVRADTYPGKRVPIHTSAAGLAILSHYPRRRIDAIVDRHGLEAMTPRSITDPETLHDRLQRTRERGYSINDQGVIEGLRAIGAPVIGSENTVIGGLSISGPINRIEGQRLDEELPSLLLGATNELELDITYQ
ncbi:IclR family transcriptional regulator [Halobacteriales archaeon QH_8_64_26]|nr:MAG: IclR family transcriptional regulator [Halobacteriales archaeon QH_8_64_26]